jgi:uncharacterized membrane protein YccC
MLAMQLQIGLRNAGRIGHVVVNSGSRPSVRAALTAYADAYEVFVSAKKPASPRIFAHSNDPLGALWTGLRAALAVFLVSSFWILTNWAHGSTAAVLGAVATARLATMAPAVPIAVGATLIFALATIPAFIIVEVLLPLADGFAMFALAVAPMLFLCAFLMAHKKTMLIGYLSALLFASAGGFLVSETGRVEGQIFAIEYRWAESHYDWLTRAGRRHRQKQG